MLLFHQDKEILSIERVTLRESGMRYICDYEIVMKDGKAEISEYGIRFENGEDRRILRRRTEVAESEALALLNKCRLLSWNGFDGPHPHGVLDGIMFRLDATVNGGKSVSASGSQNFPRHYDILRNGFYEFLKDSPELPV